MRYQESLAYESRGRIRSRIAAGESVRTEQWYYGGLDGHSRRTELATA